MDSKLTLKLNEYSIQKAKQYAIERGTSLSSMVEHFFNSITADMQKPDQTGYSPLVQELSGIISLSEDYDYKADYTQYLESKYE